jgi:RNA polymerase sigma factor (sigma-70 family)
MKQTMITTDPQIALSQYADACWKYAHQYNKLTSVRRLHTLDDLFQVGQMAVLRALKEYDPQNKAGAKLGSYIISMIRWELGHLVRDTVTAYMKMGAMVSLTTISEDRSDFTHPATYDVEDDSSDLFEELTSSLDEHSREVVRMRLQDELTFAEMGERLDMSSVHARNLFEQAMLTVKSKAASFIA